MIIGFTASAFDLFHAGHIQMLKEAKDNCDYLICGLHNDPSKERSWKNKPVQTLFERYTQLEACKYVDKIIPYETEQEVLDILRSYPLITIRFLGDDYIDKDFTGKDLCEDLGIGIYYTSRRHDFSSTELRNRIMKQNNTIDTECGINVTMDDTNIIWPNHTIDEVVFSDER